MFKLHFQNFPQNFAWMRQHICGLTPAPCPLASLSKLRKFTRSGHYYCAIVLAASKQLLLRLSHPVVLTGSPPCLTRTSLGTSGTLTPPGFRKPVEPRSFAIVEAITLPLRFCLTWRTPSASFRYVRGALPQASEPTHSASVAYFVPHFRQPQDGQRYYFREFWIRKISVFYITGHYKKAKPKAFLRVASLSYNPVLCKIRTAASVHKTPF